MNHLLSLKATNKPSRSNTLDFIMPADAPCLLSYCTSCATSTATTHIVAKW